MTAEMLPGFEAPQRPPGRVSAAARTTLDALDAAGLITPAHALTVATLFTLTDALDAAASNGTAKAYALAGLAAQITATLESLPTIPAADVADPWTALESHIAAT